MTSAELIANSKQRIRAIMRRRRAAVTSHDQALCGLALQRRLARLAALREGALLLGTLPHRGEIDARSFLQSWIEAGNPLALPRIAPKTETIEVYRVHGLDEVILGYRGIPEPDPQTIMKIPPASIRAALIPGLAFDAFGNRVGQGGGHYDRLLATLGSGCLRIGIAHDFQIVPRVPVDPDRDQAMDLVVSPIRVIECRRGSGGVLAPG